VKARRSARRQELGTVLIGVAICFGLAIVIGV
jgi:hypothetical protein